MRSRRTEFGAFTNLLNTVGLAELCSPHLAGTARMRSGKILLGASLSIGAPDLVPLCLACVLSTISGEDRRQKNLPDNLTQSVSLMTSH